ncbi:MAG: tetratricopeptide repeat protein [Dysgonamonadaceae bacterium]|jgi:tetratricopeptide (TPR) repeat protein|nr:tetratricopeptide repeat protein [Dysgonamonadaceae bacterium]
MSINHQDIQSYSAKIRESLENKRLKQTFASLDFILSNANQWQLRERLDNLEENYRMLLHYWAEGVEDPQRDAVFNGLLRSAWQLSDLVIFHAKTAVSYTSFYQNRRSADLLNPESSAQLLALLEELSDKITLSELIDSSETDLQNLHSLEKQRETVEDKIFAKIRVSSIWNEEESNLWHNALKNNLLPLTTQCLIISALTLNLEELFDERKTLLLLEAAENEEEEIRQRAITGILLFIRRYEKRLHLCPEISARLAYFAENADFIKSFKNIILQFILCRETEKITQIMNDEVMPQIKKIGPKIKWDKLLLETDFEDKNPEWQEIIEEAGLGDRLRQFSELQLEGADVMHSSFIHLKHYQFFNELGHWFVPFTRRSDHRENEMKGGIVEILLESAMLCNSDKYSFYYSILQMPEDYRKFVLGQFSSETAAIKEMIKDELPQGGDKIHPAARQYIQDLYRFYKLHPDRGAYEDIFAAKPDFYFIEGISRFIPEADRQTIGEYYFGRNYFVEANRIFTALPAYKQGDETLFQKNGYCLQMQGKLEEALQDYLKAELINSNNSWTIKKIAHCYRLLKQSADALEYYRKAERLSPDNTALLLNIGHCHLELKDYPEALKTYFKAEYLLKDKQKAWRPIAWCYFLTGKLSEAIDYYNKILEINPIHIDYLNAGHALLASGKIGQSLQMYRKCLELQENSIEKFTEIFTADVPDLLSAGVSEKILTFIPDSMLYET